MTANEKADTWNHEVYLLFMLKLLLAMPLMIQKVLPVRTSVKCESLKAGILSGEVSMYHGYEEANCNELISIDLLDPYTGFPAYKQFNCNLKKIER